MNQIMKEKKQQSTISTSKYDKKLYVSIYKSSSKGRASQETNKQTHKKTTNKSKQRFTGDLHLYKLLKNEIIR